MNGRTDIHPQAKALVGIPWEVGGRDFRPVEGGTDCLGVVLAFLRNIGFRVEDPWESVQKRYEKDKDCRKFRPKGWSDVTSLDRLIGDIAVTHGGEHLAVYVGGGYVLHAVKRIGTMLSRESKVQDIQEWWRWAG